MDLEEIPRDDAPQDAAIGSVENFSLKRSIISMLVSSGLALCVFMAVSVFYKPILTHGYSMEPSLSHGDRAIASVCGYSPACGDIVIIRDPHIDNKFIVKRIIGLSGDLINIDFTTGEIMRNGVMLDEPYILEPTTTPGDVLFPLVVPQGHVFVLGDNRNHSTDSRTTYTGMIPTENIEGKVLFRFYPFKSFGRIR